MTIEEAIIHCRNVSKYLECGSCAEEHEQLAKWLEELRDIKAIKSSF